MQTLTLQTGEQASLLTSSKGLFYFGPFLGRSCSASKAARQLQCRLDTLLYWIRKFLKNDLLKMEQQIEENGRSIKVYRSTSDEYYIPFEITPYGELRDRLVQHYVAQDILVADGFATYLRRSPMSGIRLKRDAAGMVSNEMVLDLPHAAVSGRHAVDFAGSLQLSEEQAAQLESELLSLWQRYRQLSQSEGLNQREYYWRVSFVPYAPPLS